MRLKEFLKEAEASNAQEQQFKKALSELKFMELFKDAAKNSHEQAKKTPIFYAATWKEDFLTLRPSDRRDHSGLWIDELIEGATAWALYPPRERSIKGTASFKLAEQEAAKINGNVFIIIPEDRVRIGVSPEKNFEDSFTKAAHSMRLDDLSNSSLQAWAERLIGALHAVKRSLKTDLADSYDSFVKQLADIDDAIDGDKLRLVAELKKNQDVDDEAKHALIDVLNNYHGTVKGYLLHKLDPDRNGFTMTNASSFAPIGLVEAWITGPCLALKREKYIEMYERGDIK